MRLTRATLLGDMSAAGNPEVTYAGFPLRAFSLVVDFALILGLGLQALPWAYGNPIESVLVWIAIVWILVTAYPIVFHAHWGRTVGKMLAGIKVRRLDGRTIGYREAILRSAVDLAFTVAAFIALCVTVAQWPEPEWSSLPYIEKVTLIATRDPTAGLVAVLGEVWVWSELVVLLLNEKRRAIHDYIAGTVVVVE